MFFQACDRGLTLCWFAAACLVCLVWGLGSVWIHVTCSCRPRSVLSPAVRLRLANLSSNRVQAPVGVSVSDSRFIDLIIKLSVDWFMWKSDCLVDPELLVFHELLNAAFLESRLSSSKIRCPINAYQIRVQSLKTKCCMNMSCILTCILLSTKSLEIVRMSQSIGLDKLCVSRSTGFEFDKTRSLKTLGRRVQS